MASKNFRVDEMKSIRLSEDAQRLLKLLAAYEDKTEGAIIEEALPMYLQARTLAYGNDLAEARALANATPDTAGEIVDRLTSAIEEALEAGELRAHRGKYTRPLSRKKHGLDTQVWSEGKNHSPDLARVVRETREQLVAASHESDGKARLRKRAG